MGNENNTSTDSTPQNTDKKIVKSWIFTWWPVVFLSLVLIVAGITKYIYIDDTIYSIMKDLIKSISIIMIVMYVIYTRLLSLETKKMAEASIGMYSSEKGTVLGELIESNCNYNHLCKEAQEITNTIHINEKKISDPEFTELIKIDNLPSIALKVKNMSARRIEASKVELKARHSGNENYYDLRYDLSKVGTIGPWEDKEIQLIATPEGEIEIDIKSMEYLDGGIIRRIPLNIKINLKRIRKPEKK